MRCSTEGGRGVKSAGEHAPPEESRSLFIFRAVARDVVHACGRGLAAACWCWGGAWSRSGADPCLGTRVICPCVAVVFAQHGAQPRFRSAPCGVCCAPRVGLGGGRCRRHVGDVVPGTRRASRRRRRDGFDFCCGCWPLAASGHGRGASDRQGGEPQIRQRRVRVPCSIPSTSLMISGLG